MSRGKPVYDVQKIAVVAAGAGFQVREFTVAPGEEIPWHYHSEVTDWCYCLEGEVVAQTRDRPATAKVSTMRLKPGQSCRIEPGRVHRLTSGGEAVCRYLLVQAGGAYDFNKLEAADAAPAIAE